MNDFGKQKIPFYFIIDFDFSKALIFRKNEIDSDKVKFSFNSGSGKIHKKIEFKIEPPFFSEFKNAFDSVQKEIKAGNSYLLNLTFSSRIKGDFNLSDVYEIAQAPYKLYLKEHFVVFSPETFVKINDGKIFSYPMKGTVDADIPDAENIILNDEKEIAEHYTIVDLIRNDLNRIAKKVRVGRFRYIDEICTGRKNLLQTSSEISGELLAGYEKNIGTILDKLLPAGSISGAPKKKTVEIIKSAETHDRGFYTGVAGFFDGKNLDSFVMIRFIEKREDKFYYKSGGGITAFSNAEKEYGELKDKIYIPR